jgi:Protein of unknown function (DUF2889)
MFLSDAVIPPDPDGFAVLHDREYRVRAYRLAADRLLIRGAVRDQKPPGLYADDPDPLTMHHMRVELEVAYPSLEILDATVVFDTYPHTTCPAIVDRYRSLIGLSIARGFTHRVRELFGGPRGCTHTTALLLAMAPVAVQCGWSMRAMSRPPVEAVGDTERAQALHINVDTCHVWADDGEQVADLRAGRPIEIPLTLQRRLHELGRATADWPGPA